MSSGDLEEDHRRTCRQGIQGVGVKVSSTQILKADLGPCDEP
jgi:hypothetical protein